LQETEGLLQSSRLEEGGKEYTFANQKGKRKGKISCILRTTESKSEGKRGEGESGTKKHRGSSLFQYSSQRGEKGEGGKRKGGEKTNSTPLVIKIKTECFCWP